MSNIVDKGSMYITGYFPLVHRDQLKVFFLHLAVGGGHLINVSNFLFPLKFRDVCLADAGPAHQNAPQHGFFRNDYESILHFTYTFISIRFE